MEENHIINLSEVIRKLYSRRKTILVSVFSTMIVSALLILCVPRYYQTATKLAPESDNMGMGGSLGNIASTFGIDLGSAATSDAISPLLYPELMEDNGFLSELFPIKVKVVDKKRNFTTTYFEYLEKHQLYAWWQPILKGIKKIFTPKPKTDNALSAIEQKDPYFLSKHENDIASKIKDKITINVDKQTAVITISVEDQNPLVCKCIADTVRDKLQAYITAYRTKKASIDMAHYKQLMDDAKKEYETAVNRYTYAADANQDVILMSVKSQQDELENEMQLKYNTYTTIANQYELARAKVQERTPAFTILQGAAYPIKPVGPKRVFFVLGMGILAFVVSSLYIMRKDIKDAMLH